MVVSRFVSQEWCAQPLLEGIRRASAQTVSTTLDAAVEVARAIDPTAGEAVFRSDIESKASRFSGRLIHEAPSLGEGHIVLPAAAELLRRAADETFPDSPGRLAELVQKNVRGSR